MQKYFSVLRKCSLFDRIADENLLKMLGCLGARVEHFDKKYTIFSEGSPAKHIGIALSGSAQVIKVDYAGNRSIVMGVQPSDLFGEMYACADLAEMPVSVVANEPCDVLLIDCGHILRSCANACSFHHQMIYNLMRGLAVKSIEFHQKLEISAKRTTREKLLTYLEMQAERAGARRFTIPFDRQELADYLEVDRSGLSAEISKLRNEGVLRSEKNKFELL